MRKNVKNIIIGSGLAVITYFGVKFLVRKLSIIDNLYIDLSDVKPSVSITGVAINVTPKIVNETKGELTITQPTVRVFSGNSQIFMSNPSSRTHKIKALDSVMLDTIRVSLTWSQIADLLTKLKFSFPADVKLLGKAAWLFKNYSTLLPQLNLGVQASVYCGELPYKTGIEKVF